MNRTKFTPDFEGRNPLPFQEEADKIQQSEREYQSLFEASPYPAWIVDLTTLSILGVNDAALILYGYTRKEFLSLTLHDLITPEEVVVLTKTGSDGNRLASLVPGEMNFKKHRRKDGNWFEVEVTSRPVIFQGRQCSMVLANLLTEQRKTAEGILRKKERELRLLVEQMPAVLWSTDAELRFTSSTGAALGPLNLKPGETTGLSLYEYFQTKDTNFVPIRAHLRALQGESTAFDAEWMGRNFQAYVEPLRDSDGTITGTIGVALDFTERKVAEGGLREAEARYRTLVEQIPAVTYMAHFGGAGRWTYVSPQIEKMMGYSPAEWIADSKLWVKHIHPDDRDRVLRQEQACHTSGEPFRCEYRMTDRSGRLIWFLDEAFVLRNSSGKPQFLHGVMFDITDRKLAEDAVRASEERYRVLAKATNDAVWDWDLVNNKVTWNEGTRTLFGYPPEEAAADPDWWYAKIHPEDRERTIAGIHQKIQSGEQSWSDEYRYQRADGSYAHVLDRGYIIQDGAGKPLRMIGAMMDITERKRAEEALRESEARTRMILDTALDAVITIDSSGVITGWNKQAESIFGWTRGEAMGRMLAETIIPQRYRDGHQHGLQNFLETGEQKILNNRIEIPALHRYGHEFLAELTISEMRFGNSISFSAFIRDITESKQSEAVQSALYRVAEKASRAEDMQEFYKAIHGIVGELMYAKNFYIALFDPAGQTLSFPYFVDEVDEVPEPQPLGRGLTEYVLRTGLPLLASPEKFEELKRTGEVVSVGTASLDWLGVPLKSGENTFGVLVTQSYTEVIRFGEKEKEVLTFVSQHIASAMERKRSEETIRHQAYHDALTKLPNRMLFKDRMTQALLHAHRDKQMLAMLFLDLDRFKIINDTLGHAVGDKLLQSVADRLRKCLREGDTVARLGGDEFMLMLSGIHHVEDAAKIAEKILSAIRPPFQIDTHELYINTSIGISLYPYDGEDAETLVKNADIALYRAKERGRDNYQFYASAMNAKAIEQLELENKLRRALERGEFVLHYQPQIDMYMGKIIGMEALVRWMLPEGRLVPPLEFIAMAEDTGMIVPLGEWVLRSACAQTRLWQTADFPPLRVAVNVSGRQFQQNLVQTIEKVLKKTGLDPQFLELELTETAIMKNDKVAIETLNELKSMGIQICIDDFGTGYSSLSYLKRFPIDTLKIDQSFIRDSMIDADHAAIVTAIITMAHSLKLKVVAEGVETKEQFSFLRAHNCDKMQGSLFSQPLSAEAFTKLINEFQEFKPDEDDVDFFLPTR